MLNQLNPAQREAVTHLDGPLLVLAGAGSGKTRVITQKIVHLVERCGYAPRNIAAITFTNKAASEMRERVGALLQGKNARGLVVSTFHSLGMNILRKEAALLGYKPQFSIFDSGDTWKIIGELANSGDKQEIPAIKTRISNWKSRFVVPKQAMQAAENEETELHARIYARYQETLRAYQAVDFD